MSTEHGGVNSDETPIILSTGQDLDVVLQEVMGQPVIDLRAMTRLSPEEARETLDCAIEQIKTGADVIASGTARLVEMTQRRGWEALGFEDINSFLRSVGTELVSDLDPEARKHLIMPLVGAGASFRTVGKAIGVSHNTVRRDHAEMLRRMEAELPRQLAGPEGRPGESLDVVEAELVPDEPVGTQLEPMERAHTPLPEPGEVIIHSPRPTRRSNLFPKIHNSVTSTQDGMRRVLHTLDDDRAPANWESIAQLAAQITDTIEMGHKALEKIAQMKK